MSKPSKKSTRFGMMSGLSEAKAEAPTRPSAAAAARESGLEHFSTYLSADLKKRLKFAATTEERQAYAIVEQALLDYLKKHHPAL